MKELQQLESWADTVINENNRLGQSMKGTGDRPLPRGQDIMYQAQRKYPERSPEQALSLFINDKMENSEKMDFEQNKLINAQKKQNEKLTRSLDELSTELHDHEKTAQDTEREVQRLRDLSAKLRPAGELQQQVVKASAAKVEQMLSQLDNIKTTTNLDPTKIKEIEDKIEKIKNSPADNKDIEKVNNILATMNARQNIDNKMFNTVMSELEQTQVDLAKKEERFRKSTTRNAKKIEQWGNKFQELDAKFNDIEAKANEKIIEIEKKTEKANNSLQRVMDLVYELNPDQMLEPAMTSLDDFDDKEEVQQQMTKPSATTLPPPIQAKPQVEPQVEPQEQLPLEEPPIPDFTQPGNVDDAANLAGDEESKSELGKVLQKYSKGGNMNEQIEMVEPTPQEKFDNYVKRVIERYRLYFPTDFKHWTDAQIETVIRRTVKLDLMSYARAENFQEIMKNYFQSVHNYLRTRVKPAQEPIHGVGIPDKPVEPSRPMAPSQEKQYRPDYEWPPKGDRVSESLVTDFETGLSKLTGGY